MADGEVAGGRSGLVRDYWQETRRPLACLIFVAPFLLAYESGLLLLGADAMRNGADAWLRAMLEGIGFSQYFLLPVLTCGCLLAWHHILQDRWRIRGRALYGMLAESMLFGSLLLGLAFAQRSLWTYWELPPCAVDRQFSGQLVGYLGAGIYEELLFRMMLLPLCMLLLGGIGIGRGRTSLAVLAVSLLFAAAHYQWQLNFGPWQIETHSVESFAWMTFWFRALAGMFFSSLFLLRGFGIAVGAHALYDVLVAVL